MIQYLLAAVIFVILDGIYLTLIKGYFNKQVKAIQGSDIQINFIATAITYIFLIFGINYFIIQPLIPFLKAIFRWMTYKFQKK